VHMYVGTDIRIYVGVGVLNSYTQCICTWVQIYVYMWVWVC